MSRVCSGFAFGNAGGMVLHFSEDFFDAFSLCFIGCSFHGLGLIHFELHLFTEAKQTASKNKVMPALNIWVFVPWLGSRIPALET